MTLRVVLFDFDGTLVDTTELIYQSMRHATRSVLGRELSRETLLAGVGRPLPQQMEVLDAEHAEELLETYRHHNEKHHNDFIKEFPGVEKTLARLQHAGLEVGVVTSKRRPSVRMALDSFPGLGEVTDRFVTMEDTTEHKPHPEPLLAGLRRLGGVSPEEAAYVGDSPYDIEAARAAGVVSVGVSWGAFPEDALRAAGPDYLVPDLDAAADILLELAADQGGGTS
ncbi:MAG: HAD-IA family hydrolase [Rubrobacter sp.]|nr:HAD-IA family hydrolase [Rubrobacter sp.]